MMIVSSRREDRQPLPLDSLSGGWAHRGCVIIAIIVLLGFDGILKLLHVRDDDGAGSRIDSPAKVLGIDVERGWIYVNQERFSVDIAHRV